MNHRMRKANSVSEYQIGTPPFFSEENRLVPMVAPNPTYEAIIIVYDALKGSSQAVED